MQVCRMDWSQLPVVENKQDIQKCWDELLNRKEIETPLDKAMQTSNLEKKFILSISKIYLLLLHTVKCGEHSTCPCRKWKSLTPESRTKLSDFLMHVSTCKKAKCSVKHCNLMKFFFHHRSVCRCNTCKFCSSFLGCLQVHLQTQLTNF
ncbi:hypothetical protein WA158_002947 [Blastocystis sp. Blastoise]